MHSTSKNRTPSRCREWERQRRNKFNEAISKLGEIVKSINKSSDGVKEAENTQYPKIEIIHKAILCLTNCAQEKTQLKAEILALQVKLSTKNKSYVSTDASTQVYIGIKKKSKSGKHRKTTVLQKSKRDALKEKSLHTNTPALSTQENKEVSNKQKANLKILPKLLPRSSLINKKASENTIVVLPGAPYLFPQRPLFLPSVPPAIVLLDSNLQMLNKSVPIISKNNSDITKTTMVNILPISAYSRPLSASVSKKNIKFKCFNKKTANKKAKSANNDTLAKKIDTLIDKPVEESVKENSGSLEKNNENKTKHKEILPDKEQKTLNILTSKSIPTTLEDPINDNVQRATDVSLQQKIKSNVLDTLNSINSLAARQPKCAEAIAIEKSNIPSLSLETKNITDCSNEKFTKRETGKPPKSPTTEISNAINQNITTASYLAKPHKPSTTEVPDVVNQNITGKPPDSVTYANNTTDNIKNPMDKETTSANKNKENKLPTILENTLCDNVVDGGNARLELAEELLAASPTAAFLMSFPLVSGNRADSPAEEPHNTHAVQPNKDSNHRRNDLIPQNTPSVQYFEKPHTEIKIKTASKSISPVILNKQCDTIKFNNHMVNKQTEPKSTLPNVSNENPFLNLPITSIISNNCTPSENITLDYDCNISKPPTSYPSNSNFFYKTDPFSSVKNTIYSTSSISSSHEFNSLGLYPCAMEKYTSKNKTDYTNVEDNLMKIGSSRLTYDIDLGWSHKSFEFVNCTTTSTTFNKDILTTVTAPYCTSYNPFNPEFHVSLVSTANKKDSMPNKPTASFADTITSLYSQPTNIWTEDVPFYTNNNISKAITMKPHNYPPVEHIHSNTNVKNNKHCEIKQNAEVIDHLNKSANVNNQQINEKFTKKSPSKMHINWMTSEIRPMQSSCNPMQSEIKEPHKLSYSHLDHTAKKQDHSESNYFPISMHNFPSQPAQEDFQVWPSARPLGTTEISIDPPPINLPTLVGDLALGPHDKKKNADAIHRAAHQDIQNCSNFFSVTQLMNRSTDNMPSRYQVPHIESTKTIPTKQNSYPNDANRKIMPSRVDTHPHPYTFNNPKQINTFENNVAQFSHTKIKNNKSEKSSKTHKNNYSAEALLRGGSCTQKIHDSSSTKFMLPPQKYNDFNMPQETGIAQVSHFPPILDYSDNSYTGQQFSGTTLYNTTTNTISNSFYSNFMPGSSNLMSGNYANGPFTGDFIDYNQTADCNYSNHKYEELKMRNNTPLFLPDKVPSNYKSSRRESATKHKLECSKKEPSKKYQSKRAKPNTDVDEWNDPNHLLWQNKISNKRHPNILPEELPFPNYVSNQMPTQYQPEFFNSHLMPSNMQGVGNNVDRSLASFPPTSRANFNLSTIFPEITMKVQ